MEWIPYVEIRSSATREIIGIIEGAELEFNYNLNGCGSCEVYCRATTNNLNLLQNGNYITLPNEIDYTDDTGEYCNIWRIYKIQRQNDRIGGRYIIATGQEAKCIIGNRIIRYTVVMSGDLVTNIKDQLFKQNITDPKRTVNNVEESWVQRKIPEFVFADSSVQRTIQDEDGNATKTQVSWDNLLDYTENLYVTYNCGAKLRLNKSDLKLYYTIYEGADKSNTIVFSQANENILSTDYSEDVSNYKTYVLVGGEDDETTKIRKVNSVDDNSSGIDRYEAFVDAKDLSSKYEDEQGVEKTMSDADYKALLKARGIEKIKSEFYIEENFDGEIDTTNKRYKFNEQYYLGDIVKIRDNDFGNEKKVQVVKFTRVQNMEGYKEYFSHEVKEV